jgi:hypothetical protein
VLNSARGSRSGNFAAQDAAKARARQTFSRVRWRSARALPRGKPAVNLPRGSFGAAVGDALSTKQLRASPLVTVKPLLKSLLEPRRRKSHPAAPLKQNFIRRATFFHPAYPIQTLYTEGRAGVPAGGVTRLMAHCQRLHRRFIISTRLVSRAE